MALIFFASSSEELALVRLITEPVVPLLMLFWEAFSDCALVIPAVEPIKIIDEIKGAWNGPVMGTEIPPIVGMNISSTFHKNVFVY